MRIEQRLRSELDAGGLALGMGIQYIPGATRLEVIRAASIPGPRSNP